MKLKTYLALEDLCRARGIICERRGRVIYLVTPDGVTTVACHSVREAWETALKGDPFKGLKVVTPRMRSRGITAVHVGVTIPGPLVRPMAKTPPPHELLDALRNLLALTLPGGCSVDALEGSLSGSVSHPVNYTDTPRNRAVLEARRLIAESEGRIMIYPFLHSVK